MIAMVLSRIECQDNELNNNIDKLTPRKTSSSRSLEPSLEGQWTTDIAIVTTTTIIFTNSRIRDTTQMGRELRLIKIMEITWCISSCSFWWCTLSQYSSQKSNHCFRLPLRECTNSPKKQKYTALLTGFVSSFSSKPKRTTRWSLKLKRRWTTNSLSS